MSPYQDTAIQELTAKIDKNKIKQGKRWNKMIRKIQKKSHREKYMIPVSDSQQKRRQQKADSNKTDSVKNPRSKLKVKLPGIAKKVSKIKPPPKTKIAGYSYKQKKTGKTVTVRSYTKKVLKCLDK